MERENCYPNLNTITEIIEETEEIARKVICFKKTKTKHPFSFVVVFFYFKFSPEWKSIFLGMDFNFNLSRGYYKQQESRRSILNEGESLQIASF